MYLQHQALSESGVVTVLMEVARDVVERSEVAMAEGGAPGAEEGKEDSTLKVVLSALWNLSAHCGKNKASEVYSIDYLMIMKAHFILSHNVRSSLLVGAWYHLLKFIKSYHY